MAFPEISRIVRREVLRLEAYAPGEQPSDRRTVKLNTNENPYPPPRVVRRALRNLDPVLLRRYPDPECTALRRRLSRLHRWPEEGILAGNGSDEILALLFRVCVGKGDVVQFPDPTYSLYSVLAKMQGARVRRVPLDRDFRIPFARLAPSARLTLFGHPNPPIGNCTDPAPVRGFLRRTRGLVVSDEAYADFAGKSFIPLLRDHPNLAVVRTASKFLSLAGLRLGWLLAHPSLVREIRKVRDSYNVGVVAQRAGLEALSSGGLREAFANARRVCRDRDRLARALAALGFRVPPSEANFLTAFVPPGGPGAQTLAKGLKKRGILVRYFSHPRLRNAVRITVGTSTQNALLVREIRKLLGGRRRVRS